MTQRTCTITDCAGKYWGRGYCRKHLYRLRTNGDPLVTRSTAGPVGPANASWRGDAVEYAAVHRRLREYRGRAADHNCSTCGDQANAWAYQHDAEDERIDEKRGLPYSTNLDHYKPMCHSCHNQFDSEHGWERGTPRGASYIPKADKWRAYTNLRGKQYSAGRHNTQAEAVAAARELRSRLLATR